MLAGVLAVWMGTNAHSPLAWQVERAFEKLGAERITGIIRRWLVVWNAARMLVV